MLRLIVDSTFSLDADFIQKYKIKVADLILDFDGKSYNEGDVGTWDTLYKHMLESTSFPKTSQPSPEAFSKCIDEILIEDESAEIAILTLSSKISGTYSCAKMVADSYDKNIKVIDTGLASFLNKFAMRKVVHLESVEDVENYFIKFSNLMKVRFVPQDLVYLKRGGRLSVASFLIANTLNIKPIIQFKDGGLSVVSKVIGRRNIIKEFVKLIKEGQDKKVVLAKVHNSELLNELMLEIEKLNLRIDEMVDIDPVVGCHIGPGAMAILVTEKDLF